MARARGRHFDPRIYCVMLHSTDPTSNPYAQGCDLSYTYGNVAYQHGNVFTGVYQSTDAAASWVRMAGLGTGTQTANTVMVQYDGSDKGVML